MSDNISILAKHATLKQVSEAAGVSIQTVSQVLSPRYQSRFHPDTRKKVMEAAERLRYRPNAAARSMLTNRSHIIGVLTPFMHGRWFSRLDLFETLAGMNEPLAGGGYVTSIIPVGTETDPSDPSLVFRERLLDAVIVIGLIPEAIQSALAGVTPLILWCDTNVNEPSGCIRRDERHAGSTLATKLIQLGYRRLVWVSYAHKSSHYSGLDRFAGFSEVARQQGIPVQEVSCSQPDIGPTAPELLALLQSDVAVACENHHFAQAVANLAHERGLAPGRGFGLAACDHSNERTAVFPGLSRMVLDREEVGRIAAEMFLDAVRTGRLPKSRLLRSEWHEGTTTRGMP